MSNNFNDLKLRVFLLSLCLVVAQESNSETWFDETGKISVEVNIIDNDILNADYSIIITDYGNDPSFSRIYERVKDKLYKEEYFPQTRIGFDLADENLASDFLLLASRETSSSKLSKTIKLTIPNSLFLLTAFNYMAEQGARLMVSLSDLDDALTFRVNRWNSALSDRPTIEN